MIFVKADLTHLECVEKEYRPKICEDSVGIAAIDESGKVEALCMMDSWSYNSCQIHIWIDNPFVLRHGFAEEVFEFIFSKESGRTKAIGITPSDNQKARKFNAHIGFREIAVVKDGYKQGVDYIVTELNKNECKWIAQPKKRRRRRRKHGKQVRA